MNRAAWALISFSVASSVAVVAGDSVGPRPDAAYEARPDTANEAPEILLSRQLVEQAHLRVGDLVTLAADRTGERAVRFRLVGVYEPMADPRKFSIKRLEARLHLPNLLALSQDAADPLSLESVGALNVALGDPKAARDVSAAVAARDPSLLVQSTRPSGANARDPFAVLDRFHWAISIVTVAGSTAFLLALMVMRAEERREVIGILRLIGVPSRAILLEVLLEGLLIAIGGAIFGVLVAASAQDLVNRFFQWRYDTTLVFVRVTPAIAWQSAAFAVPLGVVAGLAASWTLLRRDVVSLIGR